MSARVSIFATPVRRVVWYELEVFYVPGSALDALVMSVLDRALNAHRPLRFGTWSVS